MNYSIKSAIVAIALSAAFASNASASVHNQTLRYTVQSSVGSGGQVQVTLNDGVATLFGHVENASVKHKVKQAALKHPSVDRIVNLIVVN